ncbi:MAG: exo-alpha-sialidase [Bacteroidaceae bacterium]|nr:exo-alpha-sialidase [Bacteroidaceae bacterium]
MKKKTLLSLMALIMAAIGAYGNDTSLPTTKVEQGKVTTGIGNRDVPILRSTITLNGQTGAVDFQGVTGKISATNLKDVKAVRAYFAANARELFVDKGRTMTWRENNGTLFAEGKIAPDGTYTIRGNRNLAAGTHYLWIALDISKKAQEGHTVDATITSYTVDSKVIEEPDGNPAHAATIFLTEGSVLMPMDNGSLYYRIPAICTSADGKRLVTLTDDRKDHNADLPYHCYLVAQYSTDKGRTWTAPLTVAGTAETGGDYGHGDASLITNRQNGDIIGIMTSSHYGTGFFSSTPEKPQTWKTIVSHDGGKTWEAPIDHTRELYAAGSPHPNWLAGFTGSGAGLQKRDGTLVSPFVNRESPDGTNNNMTQNYYNFMSKDGGKTWYVSGKSGTTAADEPKVLERNNGDLAISVRAGGYNYYNVTSDDGETWQHAAQTRFTTGISGNACDGEYMYWCSTLDGNPWDIVFQTGPNDPHRQNLSIALSTDEGETFLTPKTICPRGSAYSAATVLPDGTVGVYFEEEGLYGCYTMRFVRFSLNWASDGQFSFTKKSPFRPVP